MDPVTSRPPPRPRRPPAPRRATSGPRRPGPSRASRRSSAATGTSRSARSRRPCSSRWSSAGRCSSRARPASARRSSPRCSRRRLGTRLIRLQCYEGLDVNTAVYEWNYPRQMLEIRLLEARGEIDTRLGPRHLRPGVPAQAAAAPGARGRRRRRAGAADRRDRPRGRGVRGLPARDPVRLPGHGPGDRHDPREHAAARRPDLEPDARGPRRAQAPLPVPLDRLPDGGQGVRDRLDPGARRAGTARPRGRRRSSTGCGPPT